MQHYYDCVGIKTTWRYPIVPIRVSFFKNGNNCYINCCSTLIRSLIKPTLTDGQVVILVLRCDRVELPEQTLLKSKLKKNENNFNASLCGRCSQWKQSVTQCSSIQKFCSFKLGGKLQFLFTCSPLRSFFVARTPSRWVILQAKPNRTAKKSLQKRLGGEKIGRLTKDMKRVAVFISSKVLKVIAKF